MEVKLIKNTFYNEINTKKNLWQFIKKAEKLSMGDQCKIAEKKFAEYIKRKYCVLFNSGSSANLALIQAYLNLGEIKKGDKVGVSGLTWSTNIMPLIQLGLEPIPIDVCLQTLNVDSVNLKKAIKKFDIKAFFCTNVLGFCSDLNQIKKICEEENILFFEDNCESLGSVYKGILLGNYSDACTYSFYVGHHLSTIEGGAICTDNHDLYKMLLITRAHGWDRNLSIKEQKKIRTQNRILDDFYDKYTFYDLGFNLRPTEIIGFLLNEVLQYADEIIKKRETTFLEIHAYIKQQIGVLIYNLEYNHMDCISNFAIPIVFKDKESFKKISGIFNKKNIEIRPLVAGNLTKQPFFKKYIKKNYTQKDLPNTDIIHRLGFYFGNNPDLTKKEINYIKSVFNSKKL